MLLRYLFLFWIGVVIVVIDCAVLNNGTVSDISDNETLFVKDVSEVEVVSLSLEEAYKETTNLDTHDDKETTIVNDVSTEEFDTHETKDAHKEITAIAHESETTVTSNVPAEETTSHLRKQLHKETTVNAHRGIETTYSNDVETDKVTSLPPKNNNNKEAKPIKNETMVNNDVPAEELVPLPPEQTYKEAEKEIVDFVNSFLRQLLPKIVGGSGAASLSPKCTAGMMKVFGNVRRLKGWTLKMLDSIGKVAPGLLKGTSYTMGNYDECLDISVTNKGHETTNVTEELFRGKYCRIRVQFRKAVIDTAREYHNGAINGSDLGKLKEIIQAIQVLPLGQQYMNYFTAVCLPSLCSTEDINQILKSIPFPGTAIVDRCDVKTEAVLNGKQLIVICTLLFLFILVIVSTFLDWCFHSRTKKTYIRGDHDKRCVSVSLSFSICNNTKDFMKNIQEDREGTLSGKNVRGIVVASVAWFILGQTYLFPSEGIYLQSMNLQHLKQYWDKICFAIIQAYPLAIDALSVCYGFVLTYSIWNFRIKSEKISVNFISLIIKYYIRYFVPLAFCLGITYLLPLIGSGPLWEDIVGNSTVRCQKSFWSYIGMYSNFLSLDQQCYSHLWFISCLGQLTLFGVLLCWILSKSIKFGITVIFLLWAGCCASVGYFTYENNFPPSFMPYFTSKRSSDIFWQINTALPLNHFGPYAIGMLTGIMLSKKENLKTRKCLGGLGWLACIGILYATISVPYEFRNGTFSNLWSSIYASLHRTMFGVCVAWVMIGGSSRVGGWTNAILSWRIFDPLYKLSLYAYLFHGVIISYVFGVTRTHSEYSHLELTMKATFFVASSYSIAYILFMLFEMPLYSLRTALCPNKVQEINLTPLNNFKNLPVDLMPKSTIEGNCKLWSITESRSSDMKY